MALLEVRDLSIGYDGHPVAEHLSFSVSAGDSLCILGENGAGKSTLMRTLLGLQAPLAGQIRLGDGLKRNEIGYLPQQTLVQKDFPASVREVVRSGCLGRNKGRPFYSRADQQRAEENMARMGIEQLERRSYRALSGGQQQRVLLARALCAADKLLLLDEPVAGLDPKATEELYSLIGQLNREGVTILMISHDVDAAVRQASHVLQLGTRVFFGSRDAYLEQKGGDVHG